MPSEISQMEKAKPTWFHLYVKCKAKSNKHINKINKNKLIDTDNRVVVTTGERELGEGKVGKGVQIYGNRRKRDLRGSIQYSTQISNYNPVHLRII